MLQCCATNCKQHQTEVPAEQTKLSYLRLYLYSYLYLSFSLSLSLPPALSFQGCKHVQINPGLNRFKGPLPGSSREMR